MSRSSAAALIAALAATASAPGPRGPQGPAGPPGSGGLTFDDVWPVGSVYISTTAAVAPFATGTWVATLVGRVPVGVDAGQTEFDTAGETGGSKTHTLTSAEMPVHTHVQNAHTHTQVAHTHTQNSHNHGQQSQGNVVPTTTGTHMVTSDVTGGSLRSTTATTTGTVATNQNTTPTNNNTTATNQDAGGGSAHNNLQPYMVIYAWERTA